MKVKNKAKYILIFLTFLFVFGMNLHFKDINHDIWMHIKTGEIIWNEKGLPENDVFSFTAQDNKWVFHEWLAQLIFYFFYKTFGIQSLIVLKAVVVTITLFLLYRLIDKNNRYLSMLAISLIAIGIRYHSFIRPHIFGWFFLVLTIYLIKKKKLIVLPLILIVWTNMHPSSILGFFIIALYMIKFYIIDRKNKFIYCSIACLFSLIISPLGLGIFKIINQSGIPIIKEWKPFTYQSIYFWGYLFFIIALFTLFILSKNKSPLEIILSIVLVYIGFSSRRHVALVYILLAPFFYKRLIEFIKIKKSIKNNLMFIAIFSIIVLSPLYMISNYFSLKVPYYSYPVKSVAFIVDNDIKGNIFNEQGDGGFLLFWLYPHNKIFIDGRMETYGKRVISEYLTIAKNLPESKFLLKNYNVSIIITEKGIPLEKALFNDPEWVFIGDEKRNSLFLRKNSYNIKNIE